MSDGSEQSVDVFVVEPVTKLDGSPMPEQEGPSSNARRARLGPPGVVALAEGMALLGCFFFPWVQFPALVAGYTGILLLCEYSGWVTAVGVLFEGPLRLSFFVHLWLVALTAVELLALLGVYLLRRFSTRLALGVLLALSVLALLVEGGFYWEIDVMKPFFGGPLVIRGAA